MKKWPLEYKIVTKTYLPSYLCDSSDGSDISDISDSSDSSDSSDTKKTFFHKQLFSHKNKTKKSELFSSSSTTFEFFKNEL